MLSGSPSASVDRTLDELRPLFLSTARSKERFALAQETILAPGGVIDRHRGAREGLIADIRAAVQRDGFPAIFGQQAWGLFDPKRTRAASEWQFARFAEVEVESLIQRNATEHVQALGSGSVSVMPLPCDPANPFDMLADHGLSCFSGVPGRVPLALWPADGTITRLGPCLARAIAANVRVQKAAPRTLEDVLVLEGLAAAFVGERYPDEQEPWLTPFRPPPDEAAMLSQLAQLLGVPAYVDLQANVYGATVTAADVPSPEAKQLARDELEYAWGIVRPLLTSTDPRTIAAVLYGDELIAAQGHPSLGLPAYTGFELGYRAVSRYLAERQQPVAQAINERIKLD
jgi:uncharacterized protein YjaZ